MTYTHGDILRAIRFAEANARGLFRDGGTGVPMLSHLLEVCELTADAISGDIPAVMAAVLHDDIELAAEKAVWEKADPWQAHLDMTEQITQEFGQEVAALVLENTDDPRLTKAEQKAAQLANMPHKSYRAKVIKLADSYSNTSRLYSHPPGWKPESIIRYAKSRRALHEAVRGTNTFMDDRWDAMWVGVAAGLGIT